jgi:type I restriction enzyme R subunit
LANKKEGIKEKTKKIQEGDGQLLLKHIDNPANGLSFKNIKIIDKQNIHNNSLQVINQYETTGNHKNRYDVTILVNGLPLVHIELKKRGIALKEAFNQIERYQRDSF